MEFECKILKISNFDFHLNSFSFNDIKIWLSSLCNYTRHHVYALMEFECKILKLSNFDFHLNSFSFDDIKISFLLKLEARLS